MKYFQLLTLILMLWLLSDCSLSALWVLSDLERWRLSALDKIEQSEHTLALLKLLSEPIKYTFTKVMDVDEAKIVSGIKNNKESIFRKSRKGKKNRKGKKQNKNVKKEARVVPVD